MRRFERPIDNSPLLQPRQAGKYSNYLSATSEELVCDVLNKLRHPAAWIKIFHKLPTHSAGGISKIPRD
jgi:hypothetical protein